MALTLTRDSNLVKRYSEAIGWLVECSSTGAWVTAAAWTTMPRMSAPKIKPNEETAENISVFVGIGDKNNIDRYLEALKACEFRVIAVEKPALGLMRFINQFSSNKEPYLLINIDRDGIDLIIAKQIELIFYDFDS